ncbi:MAG: exopolysaccharide biosynthesis protein [Planctomycetota bacterium]
MQHSQVPVRSPAEEEGWAMVTPSTLIRAVTTRLPSVVVTAAAVFVVVAALLLALPNRYASDGLMYVQLGRDALSVDPTAKNSGVQGISVQETRSAEVVSIGQMIGSREIAQRVVDQVGAVEINRPRGWVDRRKDQLKQWMPAKSKFPVELTAEEYVAQIEREEAIEKVQQWLNIEIPDDGYTLAIRTAGPEPFLSQAITQAVMDEYRSFHVEAHGSQGSLRFFEEQVAESRRRATQAREALQRTRSEMGWMSIESAESALRDRIVSLEVSLDDARGQCAQSENRTKALREQLANTEEWVDTEVTRGIANVAGDAMQTQLFGEQVDESEQLATLLPDHPRYRLLEQKMSRSKEIASKQEKDREQTREALNPIFQRLQSEHALAAAEAAGLKSRCESLTESLGAARAALVKLNEDAIRLTELNWQADISESNHIEHAKSLEEARIINELDDQKISDVAIIQNASLNLKKVGPQRTVLALVGALLGLALGVGQAILRDVPNAVVAQARDASNSSNDEAEVEVVTPADEQQPNGRFTGLPPVAGVGADAIRGGVLPR